jgi:alanyl-tRNA synthetase
LQAVDSRILIAYAEAIMTDRLYYRDSFLYNFDAEVRSVVETPRPALILDRTAFYPTSGGQIHDTGWVVPADSPAGPASESAVNDSAKFRVTEVADTEDGHVIHYLEAPVKNIQPGSRIRGKIDAGRRRDHMQQHSAQHVISAAFVRAFNMPTVSFHMADDYCSIDLDTPSLSKDQIEAAERLANEIVLENRGVNIRFVQREEAVELGLRKLPPPTRDELRLIDIDDFDLTACGGTHVDHTGQIGAIFLRKFEKVRQGYRVEFVAGLRAVTTARRDFSILSETAALFSAHIYDVALHSRKSLDEIKSLRKEREHSQDELADLQAAALLAETSETNGRKLIVHTFSERDLNFLKLLAQKLTRQFPAAIALLATTSPQPALVFAQSAGLPYDMSGMLKEVMAELGGRGGGSKDLAQGGVSKSAGVEEALAASAQRLAI